MSFKKRKRYNNSELMIYSEEIINMVKDILVNNEETIAVAESVTSGHLQAAFSVGNEASKFFQGGITVYNIGQKARHLNIDPILCLKVNCVAEKIANDMAVEVSKLFASGYGVGITGYASIVPECEKEGIFAYFSLSYKQKPVITEKIMSSADNPHEVQVDFSNQVIEKVYQYLQQENR